MWSWDSCNNVIASVLLIALLAGCQQSLTGAAVGVPQEPAPGREIVVNSTPAPAPQPVPADEVPETQENVVIAPLVPENQVIISPPGAEIIVIPEDKPPEDPVQACLESCDASCRSSAGLACKQTTGAACKSSCGSIIDPSACSTACSLRSAQACEPKFIEFCTAKCPGRCY